jgi:hypothetical protein
MKISKVFFVAIVVVMLLLTIQPVMAQVGTTASTSGFGAAFGYAQTIGNTAFVQTGGIGNADATAFAVTPLTFATSDVWTHGPAAAFSTAFASPFGAGAFVQTSSFFSGMAMGSAAASP